MQHEDDIRYHSRRALNELNLGLTSENAEVSRAHLKLSKLHSRRLRSLREPAADAPGSSR